MSGSALRFPCENEVFLGALKYFYYSTLCNRENWEVAFMSNN